MATFQLQSVSGANTNTATLTYSSADAQRIFTAWKKLYKADGTQQDFIIFMANQCSRIFNSWIETAEHAPPPPPDITVS